MKRIFGYHRTSSLMQDENDACETLKSHVCDEIIYDIQNANILNRPGLTKLKMKVKTGDCIVLESWSRLACSTKDLLEQISWFIEHEIQVISIKEKFDTNHTQGELMINLFHSFKQFEMDLSGRRNKEHVMNASNRGKLGGRPPKNQRDIERALRLYHTKRYTTEEIQKICDVSKSTLYRYLKKEQHNKE